MLYLILAVIAAAGFIASAVCHVLSWLSIPPPGGHSVYLLHVGIFVVWIPLILSIQHRIPNMGRGNWKPIFAVLPKWVKVAAGCFAAYVGLNFIFFIYCTQQYPRHQVPFLVELRGFSGHWMLFYGIASLDFVALRRFVKSA